MPKEKKKKRKEFASMFTKLAKDNPKKEFKEKGASWNKKGEAIKYQKKSK